MTIKNWIASCGILYVVCFAANVHAQDISTQQIVTTNPQIPAEYQLAETVTINDQPKWIPPTESLTMYPYFPFGYTRQSVSFGELTRALAQCISKFDYNSFFYSDISPDYAWPSAPIGFYQVGSHNLNNDDELKRRTWKCFATQGIGQKCNDFLCEREAEDEFMQTVTGLFYALKEDNADIWDLLKSQTRFCSSTDTKSQEFKIGLLQTRLTMLCSFGLGEQWSNCAKGQYYSKQPFIQNMGESFLYEGKYYEDDAPHNIDVIKIIKGIRSNHPSIYCYYPDVASTMKDSFITYLITGFERYEYTGTDPKLKGSSIYNYRLNKIDEPTYVWTTDLPQIYDPKGLIHGLKRFVIANIHSFSSSNYSTHPHPTNPNETNASYDYSDQPCNYFTLDGLIIDKPTKPGVYFQSTSSGAKCIILK